MYIQAGSSSGEVVGWGNNISGEATGIPSPDTYCATGVVTTAGRVLSDVEAISAGDGHSLVIHTDGTVVGFGGNFLGEAVGWTNEYPYRANAQVRIGGRVLSNVSSVVANHDFSLALKADGTVITWGGNYVPAGLTNIAAIAAEWGHSWALKRDGTIVGWSSHPTSHDYGQLLPVPDLSNVVAIAVGPGGNGTRGLALRKDSTVGTWGSETTFHDATPPAGLSNVVGIAAGYNHSLALTKDGTVTGWGFNNAGQATGIPSTNSPSISAGQVTIAGQVLSNVVSIASNRGYSLALKKDGTVVTWGRIVNDLYPVTVPAGLSNVVAIAAGESFCLAITTNSTVADRFRKSTR
jgi:alpha-tubulin suppressor-like RCC1 family protein